MAIVNSLWCGLKSKKYVLFQRISNYLNQHFTANLIFLLEQHFHSFKWSVYLFLKRHIVLSIGTFYWIYNEVECNNILSKKHKIYLLQLKQKYEHILPIKLYALIDVSYYRVRVIRKQLCYAIDCNIIDIMVIQLDATTFMCYNIFFYPEYKY